MPTPRILIVKTSSFGDILHALPLADRLRSGYPDACIDWVVRADLAQLVEGHPAIDGVIRLERKSFRAGWETGRRLRSRGYDLTLDAQGLFFSGWLAWLSGAPRRVGFDWNREGNRWFLTEPVVPAGDRASMCAKILRLADHLGIAATPIAPQRWLAGQDSTVADAHLPADPRMPIAFVVGASTPVKTLSRARWISLARAVNSQGGLPVLIGGRGEVEIAAAISASAEAVNVVGKTNFLQLAAVLDRCSVVVGGDTGAIHLAASLGVPVVGLYGPTDPAKSGPDWGSGPALVLDAAPVDRPRSFRQAPEGMIDRIPEEQVLEAIADLSGAARMVP
ncbi:MAG: glycosyltransferase family 9 protein [Armatimonadota bacterium]